MSEEYSYFKMGDKVVRVKDDVAYIFVSKRDIWIRDCVKFSKWSRKGSRLKPISNSELFLELL